MDDIFIKTGEWLANLYIGYGLFFLGCGSTFCVHLAALVFLGWRRDPRRFGRLIRALEVVYGLVNPVIYLLFLQDPFGLKGFAVMRALGWTVLLAFWLVRLWGGFERARASALARRIARGVSWAALLCVVAFFLQDLATTFRHWFSPDILSVAWWLGGLMYLNVVALYAIPVVAARRLLRLAETDELWSGGKSFYLLSPRLAIASGGLFVATVLLFNIPGTARSAESQVLAERPAILDAAERHRLDPRAIAAVLYVIAREHSAPFARQLERVAMGAWLEDARNEMGFAQPLDLSIGIAQIRPLTALTALTIYNAAGTAASPDESLLDTAILRMNAGGIYKDFRGIPRLDPSWRLPQSAVADLRPTFSGLPSKAQMVEQLFDDRQNVAMCALILALYARHWETANPAWSIRERPEILATLYQLGFERSQPKPNPRANAFGERVREVYEGAWMKKNFTLPSR